MNNLLSRIVAGIFLLTAASVAMPSFAQDNSTSDDNQRGLNTGTTQQDSSSGDQTGNASQTPDENQNTNDNQASDEKQNVEAPKAEVEKPKPLSVASWGGAYMQAQNNAYFKAYRKDTGLQLNSEQHSGQYESIKSKLSSAQWDVVDLSYDMVDQACASGLIAPLDPSSLDAAPNGSAAEEDFFKDGIHKCGVASMVWSLTIIYNKRAFKRGYPKTASDFFNVRKFRGKRALPKTPQNVMELALLADGASPGEVYTLLETPNGVDRAFNKLDQIRKSITWWSNPSEPFKLLTDGKAAFGLGYNGRAFSVIAEQKQPLGIIWDGQLYNYNLWVIPANAANKDNSRRFITFATNPQRLATQSSWFPYGPSRRSAVQLIQPHPEADIDLRPYIPTIPANFKLALRTDKTWWKNRDALKARFDRWVRGESEPETEPDIALNKVSALQSDEPIIEAVEQEEQKDEKNDKQ